MVATPGFGEDVQPLADSTDSLVAAARDAAQRDANVDAMLLLRRAIAGAPWRRAEWLVELADQTTYAGLASEAVPLYREFLQLEERSPEEQRRARLGLALALSWSGKLEESLREYETYLAWYPDDLQAQLGRARVLSWMNRNAESRSAYYQIVLDHPRNIEARRNLGRVESWRGKHRAAERQLQEIVRRHPGDAEAVLYLAQTQEWMGRPDRAKATLRTRLQADPGDVNALGLLRSIERRERPGLRVDYRGSRQTDDLIIRFTTFAQDWLLSQGLSTLGARYQFQDYDPRGEEESVRVHRPGGYGRHRFNDVVEWTAFAFVDRIDVRRLDTLYWRFTYDTWLTVWPSDQARIDVGSNRTTLDNVPSLEQNIVATYINLATDVLPNELWRVVARVKYGDFTDGNAQLWGQVEGERRLRTLPRMWAGLRSTAFRFRETLPNGYFNPSDYLSADATFRMFEPRGEDFRYALAGSAGFERASPGGSKFIWSAGVRVDYLISGRFDLGGHLGHFSSATASSSGFARTTFGAQLRLVW
jgi:tetratricopeptide (TPR) repeat protein